MRELGLCVTSAGSIRIVKRQVARLCLDTSHFTGQRRWSDAQLRRAVARAYSWPERLLELGLSGNLDDRTRVKAHAVRLGKDGWAVQVGRRPYSVGNREPLVPYDPDLLDLMKSSTPAA
jgi:hypothetical protein